MNHYLINYSRKRQYALLFGDVLVLFLALVLSYTIRIYLTKNNPSLNDVLLKINWWLILIILFHLITLYMFNQYNLRQMDYRFRSSVMVVLSTMLAGLFISAVFFFFPKYIFGRQVLLIHLGIVSNLMVIWRIIFKEIVVCTEKTKRIAVIGSEENIFRFIDDLKQIVHKEMEITDIFITRPSYTDIGEKANLVVTHNGIDSLLNNGRFDILLFDYAKRHLSNYEIRRILQMKHTGKSVFDLPTFIKSLTGKVPLNYIDGRWLLNSESLQGQISKPYVQIKRFIDIFLASIMVIICMPLLIGIAVMIKLDSKGAVIFRQERLGLRRRCFNCYKFRTMAENAEKECGPVWASMNDNRVTNFGKFLRRYRLDELPQLLNIIKGDISFVGPRPIRKFFADQLSKQIPFYELRFSVKPGLSGWAQVNSPYANSEQGQLEKFQYELFYIQNMSLFLDILTVFKTSQIILRGDGQ